MAKITFDGFDDLIEEMESRGKKVDGVINHARNAGAKIVREEMQTAIDEYNLVDSGDLKKSIKSSKIKKDKDGIKSISIAPSGKDHKGVRNMEKAMIAEYGTKDGKLPPKPWKTLAEKRAEPKVAQRMREIVEEELEKN